MKLTANIATQPSRSEVLPLMIESIYDQFDEIRIYYNSETDPIWGRDLFRPKIKIHTGADFSDNAKFYFIPKDGKPDEYYFTLDDDIIYPSTYAEDLLHALKLYKGAIVSYHGRILLGSDRPYYTFHKTFNCFTGHSGDKRIDVPGTGVTAFDTRYFRPELLYASMYRKMSDLVFGLEAAKNKTPIYCIGIPGGRLQKLKVEDSIAKTFSKIKKTPEQDKLATEIYKLNYVEKRDRN